MNRENNFDFDSDLPFDEFRDEPMELEEPEDMEETGMPEEEKSSRRGKRAKKKNPVMVYLVILFVVAFLLLLLTFFMQQRDHAALEALNVNLGTQAETIEDLQLEKQQLTLDLQKATKDLEEATAAAETADKATTAAQKTAQAVEYLAQMERACRTSYVEGYRIAKEMESKGLAEYLPTSSTVSGCVSPAKVYQSLCNTIFGTLG